MEIRMTLHTEAVQNSVMPIRKSRANRTSPVDRHLFTDKSCELLINIKSGDVMCPLVNVWSGLGPLPGEITKPSLAVGVSG